MRPLDPLPDYLSPVQRRLRLMTVRRGQPLIRLKRGRPARRAETTQGTQIGVYNIR